jgi:DNA-binding IclR family transcriptional regulator
MDLSQAEQAVLERYKERCHRAGGVQAGFGMRAKAIRYSAPESAAEIDRALQGMVEKGWLKPNAAGTWYFLTAAGAEQVSALQN